MRYKTILVIFVLSLLWARYTLCNGQILAPIINGGSNHPTASAGLVASYDFVQGADSQVLYDKSGNGNNGRLGATTGVDETDPAWVATGLSFSGAQYVEIPDSDSLSLTGDLTIEIVSYEPDYSATHVLVSKSNTAEFEVRDIRYHRDRHFPQELGVHRWANLSSRDCGMAAPGLDCRWSNDLNL